MINLYYASHMNVFKILCYNAILVPMSLYSLYFYVDEIVIHNIK